MRICIYAHWLARKVNGEYFISGTHATYLEHLSKYHDVIVLCFIDDNKRHQNNFKKVKGVKFEPLPSKLGYIQSYVSIIKYISLFRACSNKNQFDLIYTRVPDPLSWLFALLAHKKNKVVMHLVGDSIDATINSNQKWLKKILKIVLYIPEYVLTLFSAKYFCSNVYCNGLILKQTLAKYNIASNEVISSTVSEADIRDLQIKNFDNRALKFLYVGYVRPSKGVLTLLQAFHSLSLKNDGASLTIVGDGESLPYIREYIKEYNLENKVKLTGHVDCRMSLHEIYSSHDVFTFCSLSEGSPRVVIEALMAGLVVVSTKVGSLPYCFNDEEVIFTSGYDENSIESALDRVVSLTPETLETIRKNGFDKAKRNYTIENFLNKVFS